MPTSPVRNINEDHVRAAAAFLDKDPQGHSIDYAVTVDGKSFPPRALLRRAWIEAGLTEAFQANETRFNAWLGHLKQMGFDVREGVGVSYETITTNRLAEPDPGKLSAASILAAARHWREIGDSHGFGTPSRNFVAIEQALYPPKVICSVACTYAGMRPLTVPEQKGRNKLPWRARLQELGFPVLGYGDVQASGLPIVPPGKRTVQAKPLATTLREAAASWWREQDRQPIDEGPLQMVVDGRAVPAGVVLSALGGNPSTPTREALEAVRAAGFDVMTTPDPLDAELEALANNPALSNEARREITSRIGQGRFRAALLALHDNQCVLTGISAPNVLRAAHIHRWADCRDDPRAQRDPENGLLLSANVDCLFEAGLIAFADDGTVLVSPLLAEADRSALGLAPDMRLRHVPSARQRDYLARHRERTRAMRTEAPA